MSKTILKFDASSLVQSGCDKRWKLLLVDGYQEGTNGTILLWNDTNYGSALHKFDATMYLTNGNLGLSVDASLKIFNKPTAIRKKKDHLNEKHFLKTCFQLWGDFRKNDTFELLQDKDGKPLVEHSFSFVVYEDENLVILAEGTMDKLGKIKNGCFAVDDTKTTSSWDFAKFLKSYELSPQLRFYIWAIYRLALLYPDSIYSKLAPYPIGAFIDGIFLSSAKDTEFHRSDVWIYKPEYIQGEFNDLVERKIKKLVRMFYHPSEFNMRDGILKGQCNNGYGMCRYWNVCNAVDDRAAEFVLKKSFIQKPYDPLTFGGNE